MPKYELREQGYVFDTVEADDAESALDDAGEPSRCDYGDDPGTTWTTWWAVNVDDSADYAERTYQMDEDEPECEEGKEHDWQCPPDIVGGIKENPGVWGHGGGIILKRCCMNCGCLQETDTWAQNPSNGTQGHTTVRYEPGYYSDELTARAAEVDE